MEKLQNKLINLSWYPWIIFLSVTTGTFMVNVDSSILNVALPILEEYFLVGPEVLQWVISSYLLMITGILPAMGKLSDLVGRKKMFMIGTAVFVSGSLLSAISQSIVQLIIFRIYQGIGAAILQGNVMSIIANAFPAGNRGKALGMIGSVVAAGTIAGPAIGGFLIDFLGWRSIFWINFPIGLLGFIGAYLFLPKDSKEEISRNKERNLDYLGAVLFFIAMVSLLLFVSNGHIWGWHSPISWGIVILSIISGILFYLWEIKLDQPLIDLTFFRISTFAVGSITSYFSYVLIMFPSVLLPMFLYNVLQLTPIQIGAIMTFQAVAMMITAPISGFLSDRIGNLWPALFGMTIITISLFLMGNYTENSTVFYIIATISFFGIGMALFQSPVNVAIIESVPVNKAGITGGIIATIRNFGRVSGVAFAILFFQMSSIPTVFLIGSVIALFNLLLLVTRLKVTKREKKESY